jgi:hypothetical protein
MAERALKWIHVVFSAWKTTSLGSVVRWGLGDGSVLMNARSAVTLFIVRVVLTIGVESSMH